MRYKFTTRFFIAFFSIASAHSQINTAADITKQLNPAMEGLTHKVTSNMLISGAKDQFIKTSEFSVDYSRFFAKRNIGAGIHVYNLNYKQRDHYASNTEGIKLNLNKQFVLKNKLTFSTGVGLGFLSQGTNWNFTDPNYIGKSRDNALQLETGFALKGERLQLGISGGYQFSMNLSESVDNRILLNAFASYTFGRAEGWQFTPHAHVSQFGVNFGGSVSYKSKYRLSGGIVKRYLLENYANPFLSAGITLKNKFDIDYTCSLYGNFGYNAPQHSLSLKMKFGKR